MNASSRIVAFIDPYWIGTPSTHLDHHTLHSLIQQLSAHYQIGRIYWYQEAENTSVLQPIELPCTLRNCARDAIDDGFELIRAMDLDMHQLAASKAFQCFLVVSMDDRLALSIERIKAQGITVMGLKSRATHHNEESIQRMSRVFDRMLEPLDSPSFIATSPTAQSESDAAEAVEAAIAQAITQWLQESDEMTRDGAIEFMGSRRGLPRHVDSRLLFLCRKILGRELTDPEKFELRGRFRSTVQEQP